VYQEEEEDEAATPPATPSSIDLDASVAFVDESGEEGCIVIPDASAILLAGLLPEEGGQGNPPCMGALAEPQEP
jgi:hypothetical protein